MYEFKVTKQTAAEYRTLRREFNLLTETQRRVYLRLAQLMYDIPNANLQNAFENPECDLELIMLGLFKKARQQRFYVQDVSPLAKGKDPYESLRSIVEEWLYQKAITKIKGWPIGAKVRIENRSNK